MSLTRRRSNVAGLSHLGEGQKPGFGDSAAGGRCGCRVLLGEQPLDGAPRMNPRAVTVDIDQRSAGRVVETRLLRLDDRLVLIEGVSDLVE